MISAQDVKKLRDMTNAGMMDCKQALTEAEGDFEKAIEILRKKGQKLSIKRAEREAKEGVVIAMVSDDKKRGIVVRLSSETDFGAKNEEFVSLAKDFAELALKEFPSDIDGLLGLKYNGISIGEKIVEQVGVIGEKIELSDYESLEADLVVPYIHMGYRAGVIIGLNAQNDQSEEAGRNLAMQVAAMKPIAVDQQDVDQNVIEKELEIGKEQARLEGKPEQMLDQIAKGKVSQRSGRNAAGSRKKRGSRCMTHWLAITWVPWRRGTPESSVSRAARRAIAQTGG
jgi:elongation factor Ts